MELDYASNIKVSVYAEPVFDDKKNGLGSSTKLSLRIFYKSVFYNSSLVISGFMKMWQFYLEK